MEDFKLNIYFNLYKDKRSRNRQYFRCMFESEQGPYEMLDELITMVENYQIKKYGEMLYEYDLDHNKKTMLRQINDNIMGEEMFVLKNGGKKNVSKQTN